MVPGGAPVNSKPAESRFTEVRPPKRAAYLSYKGELNMNQNTAVDRIHTGETIQCPAKGKDGGRSGQQTARRIAVLLLTAVLIIGTFHMTPCRVWGKSPLSSSVLKYKKTVAKYAKKEKISSYQNILLAIMMVESGGRGKDVMQCSESLGLKRNSLKPTASIKQACRYTRSLVSIANAKKCDVNTVIQAYNFGPGYIYYVARNGRKHTENLAAAYSKKYSKGKKYRYRNSYAIKRNGGWLYGYGNMFYVALVRQYL